MNKIPYVICSSDRYSDLWKIHLRQLQYHADIRDFDVYIICNQSTTSLPGCTIVTTGTDLSWSNMLRTGLDAIPYTTILLTLDDFIIFNTVDVQGIHSVFNQLSNSNEIDFIRLIPRPAGSHEYSEDYTLINPLDKYFFSLQATVWNKKFLKDSLNGDFSPWFFESLCLNKCTSHLHLCTKSDYLGYAHHSVQRGKWFPWTYIRLFILDRSSEYTTNRRVMNPFEVFLWFLHKNISFIKSLIIN